VIDAALHLNSTHNYRRHWTNVLREAEFSGTSTSNTDVYGKR